MSDQSRFRAALLDPDLPVPEGLRDGTGRPAGRRFAVYRNNVAVGLSDALETGFPAIAKLIGRENFRAVAGVYLRQHPPTSPLMMQYGAALPDFLEGFKPLAHLGYLPDVARLEIALRQSYHAADATPVDAARIGALAPEALMGLRITLAPAVRLVRSRWPVHGIWAFNMAGGPKPQVRGENVLVTRAGFDPEPHLLPPGGGTFVTALMAGNTLGSAFETASDAVPDFDPGPVLALMLGAGAIIHATPEDSA